MHLGRGKSASAKCGNPGPRCPTVGTFRLISHTHQPFSHAFPLISVPSHTPHTGWNTGDAVKHMRATGAVEHRRNAICGQQVML
jgi:hypothetical protein